MPREKEALASGMTALSPIQTSNRALHRLAEEISLSGRTCNAARIVKHRPLLHLGTAESGTAYWLSAHTQRIALCDDDNEHLIIGSEVHMLKIRCSPASHIAMPCVCENRLAAILGRCWTTL